MGGFTERLRDKTRDNLCTNLCAIGLDARMVERRRAEEKIGKGLLGVSLGLIEIRGEPIHWVNVIRVRQYSTLPDRWTNVCIISDPTVVWEECYMKSVRVKSVPIFGQVVGLRWEGSCEGDLISQMNEDALLNQALIRLEEDVEIQSHPEYSCWSLHSNRWHDESDGLHQPDPSPEKWECYKSIARHLLERKNININVVSPLRVTKGEEFTFEIHIENSAERPQLLNSIDVYDDYLTGIAIRKTEPPFVQSFHAEDKTQSYEFKQNISPNGKLVVKVFAVGLKSGDFSSYFDVCINSPDNFLPYPIRTVVED